MGKVMGYVLSALFIVVVIALVFRIPAAKKIVTGG